MKINHLIYFALLCAGLSSCGGNKTEQEVKDDFTLGADIGWITEMESNGHQFKTVEGEVRECHELMKDYGITAVRHRVWVNPRGGWCNIDDLVAKSVRAKNAGMDVMVDFHYSDNWADPGKQFKPEAWKDLNLEELKAAIRQHTVETLEALKKVDVYPKWVQVGNEIRPGMLWDENAEVSGAANDIPIRGWGRNATDTGRTYKENWANLADFINVGYDAVKEVFSDAIVIVHLDNGYDKELFPWYFDKLKENGGKWDMIGMSLYPYWAKEKISDPDVVITSCIENINVVSERYNCDVMIVETGAECADDKGQLASDEVLQEGKRQIARIIKESRENTNGRCKGVFYWEPQCKPSRYRLGAFTEDGRPTVIMDAFREN